MTRKNIFQSKADLLVCPTNAMGVMIDELEALRRLDPCFWNRVEPVLDCWIWLGYINSGGYGRTQRKRKSYLTHRYAFKSSRGFINPDLLVCHTCDVRFCVRPSHLWQGTYEENAYDMYEKGRAKISSKTPWMTKEQAEEVRVIAASGVARKDIAKMFGVCQATVYNILSNKRWKNDS